MSTTLVSLVVAGAIVPMEPPAKYATEASEALQRSLSICQVCYGLNHPKTLQTRDKLRRAEVVAKSR